MAVGSGLLVASSQIATHADRVLKDPRARPAFAKFVDMWLEIGRVGLLHKDKKLFPEYTPSVADPMLFETQTFAENIAFGGDSSLERQGRRIFARKTEAPVPSVAVNR